MKRRTNIKVEEVSTDLGIIEIFLRPDNNFQAEVGQETVYADSAAQVRSLIYTRIKSMLQVDFHPVIEVSGSTLRDSSGSYTTEDSIRTSFYFYAKRYYLGVRSSDNGKTKKLCRLDWSGMFGANEKATPQEIARNIHDYIPLSWATCNQLGWNRNSVSSEMADFFMKTPVIYADSQGFSFEILIDYTPEFWTFLTKAHLTVMKLFKEIRGLVTDPAEIARVEENFKILLPENPDFPLDK